MTCICEVNNCVQEVRLQEAQPSRSYLPSWISKPLQRSRLPSYDSEIGTSALPTPNLDNTIHGSLHGASNFADKRWQAAAQPQAAQRAPTPPSLRVLGSSDRWLGREVRLRWTPLQPPQSVPWHHHRTPKLRLRASVPKCAHACDANADCSQMTHVSNLWIGWWQFLVPIHFTNPLTNLVSIDHTQPVECWLVTPKATGSSHVILDVTVAQLRPKAQSHLQEAPVHEGVQRALSSPLSTSYNGSVSPPARADSAGTHSCLIPAAHEACMSPL